MMQCRLAISAKHLCDTNKSTASQLSGIGLDNHRGPLSRPTETRDRFALRRLRGRAKNCGFDLYRCLATIMIAGQRLSLVAVSPNASEGLALVLDGIEFPDRNNVLVKDEDAALCISNAVYLVGKTRQASDVQRVDLILAVAADLCLSAEPIAAKIQYSCKAFRHDTVALAYVLPDGPKCSAFDLRIIATTSFARTCVNYEEHRVLAHINQVRSNARPWRWKSFVMNFHTRHCPRPGIKRQAVATPRLGRQYRSANVLRLQRSSKRYCLSRPRVASNKSMRSGRSSPFLLRHGYISPHFSAANPAKPTSPIRFGAPYLHPSRFRKAENCEAVVHRTTNCRSLSPFCHQLVVELSVDDRDGSIPRPTNAANNSNWCQRQSEPPALTELFPIVANLLHEYSPCGECSGSPRSNNHSPCRLLGARSAIIAFESRPFAMCFQAHSITTNVKQVG